MAPDLRRLFQDLLLDHYRHPRHAEPIADVHGSARRVNRLCGDEADADVALADPGGTGPVRVAGISVRVHGCTVSRAAGSLLAEGIVGLTVDDARARLTAFADMLGAFMAGARAEGSGDAAVPSTRDAALGPLEALAFLREFPTRTRCALLPAEALAAALEDAYQGPSSPFASTPMTW